eukprot:TRINITY_DN65263_c0_g1_i1.p1 TRINITY_DN65263_c0_g1~~TRINITY_DN65263_c0_g1_i1.p1  ORF type:complete len:223 (-),score=25.36 TRINITY_DN65263_c0_g1_i1:162-830(-)
MGSRNSRQEQLADSRPSVGRWLACETSERSRLAARERRIWRGEDEKHSGQEYMAAGVSTFSTLTERDEIRGKDFCYATFTKRAELAYTELHGKRRQLQREGKELRLLCCPMPDGLVGPDELLSRHLEMLLMELAEGRKLYIHCYGGHGRTGIVACSLLCLLYEGVKPDKAVEVFNELHQCRVIQGIGGAGHFPHSGEQLQQVYRVANREGPFARLFDVTGQR